VEQHTDEDQIENNKTGINIAPRGLRVTIVAVEKKKTNVK